VYKSGFVCVRHDKHKNSPCPCSEDCTGRWVNSFLLPPLYTRWKTLGTFLRVPWWHAEAMWIFWIKEKLLALSLFIRSLHHYTWSIFI